MTFIFVIFKIRINNHFEPINYFTMKKIVIALLFSAFLGLFNTTSAQELMVDGTPRWFEMMQDPGVNFLMFKKKRMPILQNTEPAGELHIKYTSAGNT